ncbi:MAG: PucR family transcriptional regulator, partial [Solirubrobacteraceae bacterium]
PPPPTPLTLVAGAVAGDTLDSVAASVADALRCPVAIAIPAHGPPVVSPPASLSAEATRAIAAHALGVCTGDESPAPAPVVEAVPVRIGDQVVGIVAATAGGPSPERRAWLEAAAAAASVTALIREAPGAGGPDSGEALVAEMAAGAPDDVSGLVARARRVGVDLSGGAVALSARGEVTTGPAPATHELRALIAELSPGRVVAVAPLNGTDDGDPLSDLVTRLRAGGMTVSVSAPRRDPALLHEAVREADLLAELGGASDAPSGGHDETYRLLIGVLLRDRAELEQLRDSTVTPLADYDDRHDTELLATLRAFLAHDGSTTETAEAMQLHRHTVGYRLSRVQEVSGLSPSESDGRERLSLGIKAHQILDADRRLGAERAGS